MSRPRFARVVVWAAALSPGCYRPALSVPPMLLGPLPRSPSSPVAVPLDRAPKEEPRLQPAEAYVRTYLTLFGGLAPLEVQRRARGGDGGQVFDTWGDYLSTLGFPDYRLDLPRATETNALMVATFERLGDALCDRAVEYDLRGQVPPPPPPPLSATGSPAPIAPIVVGTPLAMAMSMAGTAMNPGGPNPAANLASAAALRTALGAGAASARAAATALGAPRSSAPAAAAAIAAKPAPSEKPAPPRKPAPPPVDQRVIFAFDLPKTPLDAGGFRVRFDVLHRTFLGYPATLAPPERTASFYRLYSDVSARHAAKDAPRSRFSPSEAGWAAVCYGLVRHPEFLFY